MCEHDDVQAERAYDERPEGTNPLGIVGTCLDCGASMTLSGDQDEEGHPTWEARYTPGELVTIYNQTGEDIRAR